MLAFIFIVCFYATMISYYIPCICTTHTHKHIYLSIYLSIYNGGALWWAIYMILIGHMGATYDLLPMNFIYTVADVCTYMCIFTIITIHNIPLLQTKRIIYLQCLPTNVCDVVCNCLHCLLMLLSFSFIILDQCLLCPLPLMSTV